jgi:hypothetical protein
MSGDGNSDDEDQEMFNPNNQPDRIRQYPANYVGVYEVFIRRVNVSLKHLDISKKIHEAFPNGIRSLMKINSSKIRVVFIQLADANKLPKCEFLKDYRVYIPAISVEISGLITISTDTTTEEIIAAGKGQLFGPNSADIAILDAYRFYRNETQENGMSKKIPTQTVRVTFEGTLLPKWLQIHGLITKVKLHVPKLMHCDNCLGHGHTSKYCSAKTVCYNCGEPHGIEDCKSEENFCVHCKQIADHSFKDCSVYQLHIKLLKQKTVNAAKQIIPPRQNNIYNYLANEEAPGSSTQSAQISSYVNEDCNPPKRKRSHLDGGIAQKNSPLKTRQQHNLVRQNLSFAQVAGGSSTENANASPSTRNPLRNRENPNEHRVCGGDSASQTRSDAKKSDPKEDSNRRTLKDAIKAFIITKNWHPLLSSVVTMIVAPIVDWIWPMIYPIFPFLLSFLNQNG